MSNVEPKRGLVYAPAALEILFERGVGRADAGETQGRPLGPSLFERSVPVYQCTSVTVTLFERSVPV
jgi:hypothetical protein